MKRLLSLAALVALVGAESAMAQQLPSGPPTGLDFSGLMYGSYSIRLDSTSKAGLGGKSPNQFGIDRLYLTFRMPAGDNGQIRVTTDVYQNLAAPSNAYYQGWAIRLKYAYFQYTGLAAALGPGSSLAGRVGFVHDVAIDQAESSWPRYLRPPSIEFDKFFSSSDLGVAGLLTLPSKWGEVYGVIVNGPGYMSAETDRFKDVAVRATIFPFAASSSTNAFAKSFAIVPWGYKGFVGSAFAAGGAGETGPGTNGAVTDAMPRDRYGVLARVKTRPLSAAVEFAQRVDASEAGQNTAASPRSVTDSTGRLVDAYVIARPLELLDASKPSAVSLIARYDRSTPNLHPRVGAIPSYGFFIVGAAYDLTSRITLALDWQGGQSPWGFPPTAGTNIGPTTNQSICFVHWYATF